MKRHSFEDPIGALVAGKSTRVYPPGADVNKIETAIGKLYALLLRVRLLVVYTLVYVSVGIRVAKRK